MQSCVKGMRLGGFRFIVANWVSIEVHLGYDFPWAAHQWIPIYGGAPSHDLHHARPLSNFEPWLNYLDKLMGGLSG